jgi:hypothetical protein
MRLGLHIQRENLAYKWLLGNSIFMSFSKEVFMRLMHSTGLNVKFAWPILTFIFLLVSTRMAQATGFLSLESSPTGAEVWYTGPDDPDRKYLGDTPLESRELTTGRYDLWLILPSHDTLAISDVVIAEGQVTQLNREIPTHYGFLEVLTQPDSSEIWLDGVRIGPSPYVNNLVLPGISKLKVVPRESHFKNSMRTLSLGKGDSTQLNISSPYRDKSFGYENLSLPPLRFQIEAGLGFRSVTAVYDSAGKRIKYATDSIPSQWDIPLKVRLGLPHDFEIHLELPFKNFSETEASFRSNMKGGVKYTLRPYNVGFDISYGLGLKNTKQALGHDFLALTLLAAASKGKIVGQAQAGFEFHFAEKSDNKKDPGEQGIVHAQIGYLVEPFMPYLGLTGMVRLNGDDNGKTVEDGGHLIIPEPGLIIDVADLISFQFGVPFTIAGKNGPSYWGMHLSMSLGFGM